MVKVSVCLPCYNNEKYVAQAIESVIAQNYDSYEFIIVDDNSTDRTVEIVQKYAKTNNKIDFYQNEKNYGIVGNFNRCLSLCRGEFVKFILADDLLINVNSLRRFVDTLESNQNISIVSSSRKFIDSDSKVIGESNSYNDGCYSPGTKIISDCLLYMKNKIGDPSSVIFRRSHLHQNFDKRYKQLLDLDMWFKLLEVGDFYYIEDSLVAFRHHDEQATKRNKDNFDHLDDFSIILKTYSCKNYMKLKTSIKLIGLIRSSDKAFKLYKRGYLDYDRMRNKVQNNLPYWQFLLFRPFYKVLKNVIRLKFLR